MIADFFRGIKFFLDGFKIIRQPGIRRYVILPIMVNIVLFSLGIYVFGSQFNNLMERYLPDSEGYWIILVYFLWVVFSLLILIVVFFTFTLLANLIGSPFNGPLAAAVERRIDNQVKYDTQGNFISDAIKAVLNELRKWLYYLYWVIPLLLISFIPLVNFASPFLWFLFGAWILALEYIDYPMGNHGNQFNDTKAALRRHRMLSLGFGTAVMGFTMIPLINLIVMPAAVAGAAKLWVNAINKR